MLPTPKNHFKQYPFVDRENQIQTFIEAVNNIGQKEFSVLVYYGVAGIGKTSLRKELSKYLEEYNRKYQNKEIIWASIDLQLEKHREKTAFLVALKNELQRKLKIKFPAFEIAHAIYWKKTNPEIPLRKENYLFFEGDDAFDDFFGIVEKIPYLQVVPTTARLLKNAPDYLRKWWKKRGENELSQLSEKEPLEVEEILPYFWAQDLNNYLERTSKSAVLFIDTYEALWEKDRGRGNFNAKDEWIRELILNLSGSALWVICGREELRWNEVNIDWDNYLEQCEIEKLPEEDALDFLNRCGIKEEEIQKVILRGSEGVPYYLELAVDTYTEIKKTGSPVPDNFARTRSEIFDRFMIYLSTPEQETLKVLSTPRFWNKDIFRALIENFKTGYPLTAFSELNRFSFIQETEGKLLLHPLMRESLQVYQDQKIKEEVHSFMYTYYSDQLKSIDIKAITSEHENVLIEAFYHAKIVSEIPEVLKWLVAISRPFEKAAFWNILLPLYEEILQIQETSSSSEQPDMSTTLHKMALMYSKLERNKEALLLYERSLKIREDTLDPEHLDVANSLNNIGWLHWKMGEYKKALPYYQRSLEIRKKKLGDKHRVIAITLNNMAVLYKSMGEYEKALVLYQQSLDMKKMLNSTPTSIASTLNNMAVLYGITGKYDEAMSLCQQSLEIKNSIIESFHPSIAETSSNLAEIYNSIGRYEEAVVLCKRALKINENFFGTNSPSVARTQNNLAKIYGNMQKYEKALPLYQQALDTREKNLGIEHPDVAETLNNLAGLYESMGDYEKALTLYQRALEIVEKKLGQNHPDTVTTRNNCNFLLLKMNESKEK